MTKEHPSKTPANIQQEAIDLLKQMPQEEIEILLQRVLVQSESYSGPVMHPRDAEDYEKILPGSAERMFSMTEKQLQHRIKMEECSLERQSKALDAQIAIEEKTLEQQSKALEARIAHENKEQTIRKMGMRYAFVLMVLFLAAGCVMACLGHEIFGGAIISMAGLGSIIGHFITKRESA